MYTIQANPSGTRSIEAVSYTPLITPEGTRKANPNWKKCFYFIALKAQVPIVLIGIDYSKKTIAATKAIMPSGDINKDMSCLLYTSLQLDSRPQPSLQ